MSVMMLLRKTLKVIALGGATALVLLWAMLWLDHRKETILPAPTGPFAVGRATFAWHDPTHPDPMSPVPGTKRELLTWIWYPADAQSTSPTADDYLPIPWRDALEHQRGALIMNYLTRDLSRVRTHSFRDASPAAFISRRVHTSGSRSADH